MEEEIQHQAQQRIVARAGRRTAERARRKRITDWKSPTKELEKKQLFPDDAENVSPETQNTKNKKKEVKLKKTASFKVQASVDNHMGTPKVKKMPMVHTPAHELRDKRKAKTPLSAKSACSDLTKSPPSSTKGLRRKTKSKASSPLSPVYKIEKIIKKKSNKAAPKTKMVSSPLSPSQHTNDSFSSSPLQYSPSSTYESKKESSPMALRIASNGNNLVSPNTFLKHHPYPDRYRGMTPGANNSMVSPAGRSDCDSEWTAGNQSYISDLGDLSLNDNSYADDDDEALENDGDADHDDSLSSPMSVRSGKWCKSLHEKIEAAGLSPQLKKDQLPEHLQYVRSYAEEYVEGESDESEWESVKEDSESEESEESFD